MGEVCFAGRVRSRSLAAAGTMSSRSHESRINHENGVLFSTDIDISFSVHLPREQLRHCSNHCIDYWNKVTNMLDNKSHTKKVVLHEIQPHTHTHIITCHKAQLQHYCISIECVCDIGYM